MQGVEAALLRAARRAREIARQTNTPLIIERDGKIVEEWVTDIDDE
jgi:DNA-directed RNA polymerase subunit K/omega